MTKFLLSISLVDLYNDPVDFVWKLFPSKLRVLTISKYFFNGTTVLSPFPFSNIEPPFAQNP